MSKVLAARWWFRVGKSSPLDHGRRGLRRPGQFQTNAPSGVHVNRDCDEKDGDFCCCCGIECCDWPLILKFCKKIGIVARGNRGNLETVVVSKLTLPAGFGTLGESARKDQVVVV